jgi:hypothetical protein
MGFEKSRQKENVLIIPNFWRSLYYYTKCSKMIVVHIVVGSDNLSVLNFDAYYKNDTNYQEPSK